MISLRTSTVRTLLLIAASAFLSSALCTSARAQYTDRQAIDDLGGPSWLARSASWLVPKPDLLFILDAPVQVILSRKQEVLPEEVLSQRRVYLHFASSFSHSRVIDSTAPLERVVAEAGQMVREYLAQRFEHRYAPWLGLGPHYKHSTQLKVPPGERTG